MIPKQKQTPELAAEPIRCLFLFGNHGAVFHGAVLDWNEIVDRLVTQKETSGVDG